MEAFLILLALLVLAFPIIAIVALVKAVGAGDQLRRVELRLEALEHGGARATPSAAVPQPAAPPQRGAEPSPATSVAEPLPAGGATAGGAHLAITRARTADRRHLADRTAAAGRAACFGRTRRRAGHELRGAPRHAMGGLGRRHRARARRHLSRALFDRAGTARPRRARHAGRAVGDRARRCGRMGAPDRAVVRHFRPAHRAHPGCPDGGRHDRRLCRRLRRLCALRVPVAGPGLHPARPGGAGDAGGGAAARARARWPRPGRRLRHAAVGCHRQAGLLVALHLSRSGDRRSLCARALSHVALARRHRGRAQRAVDLARSRGGGRRGARGALLPRHRRLCAGGDLDRCRPALWTRRGSRSDRRRVVGRARRLPLRHSARGAGQPARSGRAHDVRGARRGHRRDRLARRGGRRGRAGGRGARRPRHRALGSRHQPGASGRALGPDGRRGTRAAEGGRRLAPHPRHRLCGIVRRGRFPRARPLGAADRADAVERIGGVRADRHCRRALLPHRQARAVNSVRGNRIAARGAVCARDRNAG